MSELEDIKLKALLEEIQLESPSPSFTSNVMDSIYQEKQLTESATPDRVLGKSFWIILILFVVLIVLYILLTYTGANGSQTSNQYIQGFNNTLSGGIESILGGFGSIPVSIAGILLALSSLLFIDRFISSNSRLFQV